jgi:hypothetical protein
VRTITSFAYQFYGLAKDLERGMSTLIDRINACEEEEQGRARNGADGRRKKRRRRERKVRVVCDVRQRGVRRGEVVVWVCVGSDEGGVWGHLKAVCEASARVSVTRTFPN